MELPLLGVTNKKERIQYIKIDNSELALDRLDGVPLMGGHDGSFENGIELEGELLENLYIKAFQGELDRTILSPRRTPVKYMLDANYPLAVKRAMVNLAIQRYDAFVYLDAGIITTHDEGLIFGEDSADLNYRIVSKGFQCYQIRDPYNGKKVDVTYTYHLAQQLARHIELVGSHVPFTGESHALLTGAVKNSVLPVLDEYDEEMKEQLYDLRLNYYEALGENIYARGTQVTAQDVDSDLSEEHNMVMTLEIKDIAEKETIARRYNFAEPEDRQLFTEVLTERTKSYRDVVRSIQVIYDMTKEDNMEQEPLAGANILRFMKLRHLVTPVIIVTMYESFVDGVKINALNDRFSEHYSEIYKGFVYYSLKNDEWKDELIIKRGFFNQKTN